MGGELLLHCCSTTRQNPQKSPRSELLMTGIVKSLRTASFCLTLHVRTPSFNLSIFFLSFFVIALGLKGSYLLGILVPMWAGHLWKQHQPVLQPPVAWWPHLKAVDWAAGGPSVNFWGWGMHMKMWDRFTTMSYRWLVHQVDNTRQLGRPHELHYVPSFPSERNRAGSGVAVGVNWEYLVVRQVHKI